MNKFNTTAIVKAWAVFFVLALVMGFVAGAIAGGITGFLVVIVTGSKASIPLYSGIAGFLAGLPFSFLSFHFAVQKFLTDDSARAN